MSDGRTPFQYANPVHASQDVQVVRPETLHHVWSYAVPATHVYAANHTVPAANSIPIAHRALVSHVVPAGQPGTEPHPDIVPPAMSVWSTIKWVIQAVCIGMALAAIVFPAIPTLVALAAIPLAAMLIGGVALKDRHVWKTWVSVRLVREQQFALQQKAHQQAVRTEALRVAMPARLTVT